MSHAPKTQKAVEEAKLDAEALAAEVAALRKELETMASHIQAIGRAGAEDLKAAAQKTYRQGRAKGEELFEELQDEWATVEQRVAQEVRDNPWRTIGLATLTGLVLGLLMRR